jgi:hypothetical protein
METTIGILMAKTPSSELNSRLNDITAYFASLSGLGRPVFGTSVEQLLSICPTPMMCILASGALVTNGPEFAAALQRALPNLGLVCGALYQDATYFSFDPSCLIVNQERWLDLGMPALGIAHGGVERLPEGRRSYDNIYDANTPASLAPADSGTRQCIGVSLGWNMIATSLEAGLTVQSLPVAIHNCMRYPYPDAQNAGPLLDALNTLDRIEGDEIPLLAPPARQFILWLSRMRHHMEQRFVFIGAADPVLKLSQTDGPLAHAYGVCAGFTMNLILQRTGFSKSTEVTHFDVNLSAIRFQEHLLDQWDGVTKTYPHSLAEYLNLQPHELNMGLADFQNWFSWLQETYFKGEAGWLDHWGSYRKAKHRFVQCDVLVNPEALLPAAMTTGRSVLWYGDLFDYDPMIVRMGRSGLADARARLERMFRQTHRHIEFLGRAPGQNW